MITADNIKANAVLSALTEEQMAEVVTLSNNSEKAEIDKKTAEFSGVVTEALKDYQRNADEDEGKFIARIVSDLSASIKTKEEELGKNAKEITRLNKAIQEGANDTEIAKKYQQSQKDLEAITKQFAELKTKSDESEAKHKAEIFGIKIDAEFDKAVKGLNFKSDINEAAKDALTRQAVAKIKGFNPEYIDTDNGVSLVFKGDKGEILRNTENLNPMTASELLKKELSSFGILEDGNPNKGGGTSDPKKPTNGVNTTGAKTQTEAYEILAQGLFARGLVNGSKKFTEEMAKLYKENNIEALPLK